MTKRKENPQPGGRPTKFTPDMKDKAEDLAREGKLDKDIAAALKICEATLNNYKSNNPEFLESIKRGKDLVDDEAEASLYSRVKGFAVIEQHIQITRENGEIRLKEARYVSKVLPPDVTACQTWLNNRRPSTWRQKIPELSNLADNFDNVLQMLRQHHDKKIKTQGPTAQPTAKPRSKPAKGKGSSAKKNK